MRIAKYRHIIVLLLMMTFIGQAVASTVVSCQSQSAPLQSHEQVMVSGEMDHSQHMMSLTTSSTEEATEFSCCADCDCSLGGCSTLAALLSGQQLFLSDVSSLARHYSELLDGQVTVSLFRPPISQ